MTQLALSTLMVSLTIFAHLIGLSLLLKLLRHAGNHPSKRHPLRLVGSIMAVAWGLFALHTFEIWFYAALYYFVGASPSFEQALYFSTVTYATIGYGDVTLSSDWRVMGAIEGANGVILLGWSTAFFISVVEKLKLIERELAE
ncbi:MAG: two pore domain potassium channel family protein [Rhodospirillaceae bacterium]|nr:two pore domain potassium channel family protein [Rhodospirillaceae bacterium]